jgi:hypothetical protein
MKPVYGKNPDELSVYAGSPGQLARVRTSVLDDGRARGVRIADIDNGTGLRFTVLLDRGMDLADVSFRGIPFAYMTPVGIVHPSYFEPDGTRWLRSFGGGLMTGCGLRNVGSPSAGDGLHGRLSNTPAENISISKDWKDGKYFLSVNGAVREVSFFGENLELRRTISTAMGDNSITISDKVTNRGVRSSPLMILYHINAGFPLLNESARVDGRVLSTEPRNAVSAAGLADWAQCIPPAAGYEEQCFFHDVEADKDGFARMTLRNPELELAMTVAYRKAELPFLTQWKMMGEQEYVMGVEPGNCCPTGQAAEKERGDLRLIEPGESVEFNVVISFSDGN